MKITIKNLKIAAFASDDSVCYACTVYVDGQRAFTAKNEGQGGFNLYDPVNAAGRTLLADAEAYARALPPFPSEFGVEPLPMDLESLLAEIIELDQTETWITRQMRQKTLFLEKPTLSRGEYRYFNRPWDARLAEGLRTHYPDLIVLNDLPLQQAVALVV